MTAKSENTVTVSREEAIAFARAWATPDNLAMLDAISEDDIARQIAEDPDVAPELTDEWFENARLVIPLKGRKKAA
jgi:hypothetical protein